MLKRIEVTHVRAGMFIEAIEGAWQEAFLTRRRFLLKREADAQRLKASGVEAVVINTARGLDADGSRPRAVVASVLSENPIAISSSRTEADVRAARRTIQQSTQMLERIFDQFLGGGAIDLDDATPVISQISQSIGRNPSVFISVTRLKSKDEVTFLHSISVSALMIHFSRYLGLDEPTIRLMGIAGLLHDVGKLEVPPEILTKEGRLTDAEMNLIRLHPAAGHAMLSRHGNAPELVLDVCLNHHERMDGKGYPGMLSGEQISSYARIAAICDVYDAVTSIRPYKMPWSAAVAIKWMLQSEGQFDRGLLKDFAVCLAGTAT